jgi:plastocyanin
MSALRPSFARLAHAAIGGAALVLVGACGLETPVPPSGPTITIQSFAYAPAELTVDPGATITVQNLDPEPHSVTSESALGQYTPGAVAGVSFDTGAFAAGTRTITIPSSAPHGTVVPYYCSVHTSGMAQGHVMIR